MERDDTFENHGNFIFLPNQPDIRHIINQATGKQTHKERHNFVNTSAKWKPRPIKDSPLNFTQHLSLDSFTTCLVAHIDGFDCSYLNTLMDIHLRYKYRSNDILVYDQYWCYDKFETTVRTRKQLPRECPSQVEYETSTSTSNLQI